MSDSQPMYQRPADLLQQLIRFDTTNPPGNEAECVGFIRDLLAEAGIPSQIVAQEPERPNLTARLPGRGEAPPLLLYGHVDVVSTEGQQWTRPPFKGVIEDGFLWGRGALDMKSGVAMMVAAILRAKAEGFEPAGDLVLAILVDEEAGGNLGAKFLVEEHPDLFEGIRFALGEVGGTTLHMGGQRFYPIQIAEKQLCWMKATVRGPGGHGARPMRGGAMARLGQMLTRLDQSRLPVHITPVAKQMVETIAGALPYPAGSTMRLLLDPDVTDSVLNEMGDAGLFYEPLLRNTVNATIVQGGSKVNVIPGEISLQLDGRLLPGFSPQDLIGEIRAIIGSEIALEVLRHDPSPGEADMTLFDMLGDVLREADPGSVPVPYLLSGVTDGRFFARLGIQTYGFTPLKLSANFDSTRLVHAADERVPLDALDFGANTIYEALRRYRL